MPDDPKTGSRSETVREAKRRQSADKEQATGAQQEEDFERAEAAEKRQAANASAAAGPASRAGTLYRAKTKDLGAARRRIVGAVAFSVLFALLGVEIEGTKSTPAKTLSA